MKLVQNIVVSPVGCHEEVVTAVTRASVLAYLNTQESFAETWTDWLSGPFTKTVRRGTNGQFNACRSKAAATVDFGAATALGFTPCLSDEVPDPLPKMQVDGLERGRFGFENLKMPWYSTSSSLSGERLWICVNPDLEMSTGKTAAQTAHGLFGWTLKVDKNAVHGEWEITDKRDAWDHFTKGDTVKDVVRIMDEGLTEIEPNSLTVVVGRA